MTPPRRTAARTGSEPAEPPITCLAKGPREGSTDIRSGKDAFRRVEFRERPVAGLKRWTAKLLAQVSRVLAFRRAHGVRVDTGKALHVLGALLDAVPPTIDLANGTTVRTEWCGFTDATLAVAAIRARLVDLPGDKIENPSPCAEITILRALQCLDVERVHREIAVRRRNHGHKPMRVETISTMLEITAEERIFCKAWDIPAIDETVTERISRQAQERVQKQRDKRRAAGMKARPGPIAPQPGEESLSKRQLYNRRKAEAEGRVMRRNQKSAPNVTATISNKRRGSHTECSFAADVIQGAGGSGAASNGGCARRGPSRGRSAVAAEKVSP